MPLCCCDLLSMWLILFCKDSAGCGCFGSCMINECSTVDTWIYLYRLNKAPLWKSPFIYTFLFFKLPAILGLLLTIDIWLSLSPYTTYRYSGVRAPGTVSSVIYCCMVLELLITFKLPLVISCLYQTH